MSDKERESRAIEALIVHRMRQGCDDNHPPLTDEEKAALKCLDPHFIDAIIAMADAAGVPDEPAAEKPQRAGRQMATGMNRADDPDASKGDIEQHREDVLKKLEEEDDARRDRESG